jgi:hypothetical protein
MLTANENQADGKILATNENQADGKILAADENQSDGKILPPGEIPASMKNSVADSGCLSRIPDPDFYPSRIPDLGSRIQKQVEKRGVKNFFCQTFFCSHKFHKM